MPSMLTPATSEDKARAHPLYPPLRFRENPMKMFFHHTLGEYNMVNFALTVSELAMRAYASVLFTSSAIWTTACVKKTATMVGVYLHPKNSHVDPTSSLSP